MPSNNKYEFLVDECISGSPAKAALRVNKFDGDLELVVNGRLVAWIKGEDGILHRMYGLPKGFVLPLNEAGEIAMSGEEVADA